MRKNLNSEVIIGSVYEHSLSVKEVKNQASANYGKPYISGSIHIAVDNDLLNVIEVYFSYVTELTSKGTTNATYTALKKIIDENKTVVEVGAENAIKVRVNTSLALNEFYGQDGQLVSAKRNEGGFVSIINTINQKDKRNKFDLDMVITGVNRVEADTEKNILKDYITIKGVIFNFRNEILPVDFKCYDPEGMKFFEDQEISGSNPYYTKVWGDIISQTIVTERVTESAFGEAAVQTYTRRSKDWVVTGCSNDPYEFGEENVLTAAELTQAIQDREVKLADLKKRAEEYQASKNTSTVTSDIATAISSSTVKKTVDPFVF